MPLCPMSTERRHRQREVELDDAEARTLDCLDKGLAGEKVDVRAVEQATIRVAPTSAEQTQPERPVRHVRCRENEPPVSREQRLDAREEALRIAKVLDEVAAENDVEGAALEG